MAAMIEDICLPRVSSILILDGDGNRIAAKFFEPQLQAPSKSVALQQSIYLRSKGSANREEGDVVMLEDHVVVFRSVASGDATFYVVGETPENEIILMSVLDCLVEAVSRLLKGTLDRRNLIDNLALLLLTLDEVVDSGMILETNPNSIYARVLMRSDEDAGGPQNSIMTELTISEALKSASDSIRKSMGRT